MTLEERIDEKIKNSNFTALEILGFQQVPTLALKAGIAIGYQMGSDDAQNAYNESINKAIGGKG